MRKRDFKELAVELINMIPVNYKIVLRDQGLLGEYISEFILFCFRKQMNYVDRMKIVRKHESFELFIKKSFDWGKTQRGIAFWYPFSRSFI